MKHGKTLPLLFALTVTLAVICSGCGPKKTNLEERLDTMAARDKEWRKGKTEAQMRSEIGQGMAKGGVMSQADYVRLRAQIDGIRATGKISDSDLDWALSLLKQSKDPLAHSRVMTGLSILRQCPASQKVKINAALTPYLSSSSLLDQTAAKRLQRAMGKL